MRQEFAGVDSSGDGRLDYDEIHTLLTSKGVDEEYCSELLDEIFDTLDIDAQGRVDLDKISENYVKIKNKLVEKEQEFK